MLPPHKHFILGRGHPCLEFYICLSWIRGSNSTDVLSLVGGFRDPWGDTGLHSLFTASWDFLWRVIMINGINSICQVLCGLQITSHPSTFTSCFWTDSYRTANDPWKAWKGYPQPPLLYKPEWLQPCTDKKPSMLLVSGKYMISNKLFFRKSCNKNIQFSLPICQVIEINHSVALKIIWP